MNEIGIVGKNFIDQNYIEVVGEAELEISPDIVYLKIVLKDKNNKDKKTLPEIEKNMISKLSEIGIDINKDLSFIDLESNLTEYFFKTNVLLTKTYQLIVHDVKSLQKTFLVFQELSVSDVSILKFEFKEIEKIRKEVQVLALKAAKEKAEVFANALNRKIGKAIFVQELQDKIETPNIRLSTHYEKAYYNGYGYGSQEQVGVTDIEFKSKLMCNFLTRFILD